MKVNLGCGENKLEGYTNIDKREGVGNLQREVGVELLHPLQNIEEVIMHHSAEHFPNFIYWVTDLASRCKNGCLWKVTTPYATSTVLNLVNPYHVNPWFTEHTFRFFDDIYKRENNYNFKLKIEKVEYKYNHELWDYHDEAEWERMRQKYLNVVKEMYQEIRVIK